MSSFLSGYALSLSLILAIGAQNAFVLRQGLMRQHVLAVCLFCGLSDALLIGAGVAGFGALVAAVPSLETVMRWGGAAFLTWYGLRTARGALAGGQALDLAGRAETSRARVLATLAALTWLNPHVYLDTLVLIGSISAQAEDRLAFGTGAALASLSFFFALGYGARLLAPLFRSPRAWQVFDALVAATMFAIAASLVLG